MAKTYTLTLSEEQAQLLVKALDLYSRIGIGQFEEILDVYDPLCKGFVRDSRGNQHTDGRVSSL